VRCSLAWRTKRASESNPNKACNAAIATSSASDSTGAIPEAGRSGTHRGCATDKSSTVTYSAVTRVPKSGFMPRSSRIEGPSRPRSSRALHTPDHRGLFTPQILDTLTDLGHPHPPQRGPHPRPHPLEPLIQRPPSRGPRSSRRTSRTGDETTRTPPTTSSPRPTHRAKLRRPATRQPGHLQPPAHPAPHTAQNFEDRRQDNQDTSNHQLTPPHTPRKTSKTGGGADG